MSASQSLPSSFRDPSGFVFRDGAVLYRQVNFAYRENYDLLMQSGLYQDLTGSGLLIPHEEVELGALPTDAYKILKPEPIPFISYPYEWSFSQLRDAALTTLRIQKRCLDFGMSLKDSSAFNIQFRKGKPILIDTLSFEKYCEGSPWVAYRQFCQHFLAPLALMSRVDVRLGQLSRTHIDGVPLDLASTLLPARSHLNFSLLSHIHLHARAQKHLSGRAPDAGKRTMSRFQFLALLDSLSSAVSGLKWRPRTGGWAGYYDDTNYTAEGLQHKAQLVGEFLDDVRPAPGMVWDLGANTGMFSRIASRKGMETIAFDNDPVCVEASYVQCRQEGDTHLVPLVADLTNPSPSIGWANEERMSLAERGPADVIMALALVHHLAIANNLPLGKIADTLSRLGRALIIEFVPKSDSQVQRLLASRQDIFGDYTRQAFEAEFARRFTIGRAQSIRGTQRTLYLMERRDRRSDGC